MDSLQYSLDSKELEKAWICKDMANGIVYCEDKTIQEVNGNKYCHKDAKNNLCARLVSKSFA